MNDIAFMDATAQAALVRNGKISARELVGAAIERIERLNPQLNAVITPLFDQATAAATKIDPGAAFAGVPFVLKDLVSECRGSPRNDGSGFVGGCYISERDNELVSRYKRAGLIVVGKTNTSEFGLLPTTEPQCFGPTRNPWDPERGAGGSSGGSSAAVAAGLVAAGHANDGGGSIRIPASCCGLVGLKPTRGRNTLAPGYGDIAGGIICEHVVTRSVRDSAALLDATAGSRARRPLPRLPGATPVRRRGQTGPGALADRLWNHRFERCGGTRRLYSRRAKSRAFAGTIGPCRRTGLARRRQRTAIQIVRPGDERLSRLVHR